MEVQVYKGTGISRYRYMKVQVYQGKGGEDVVKGAVKVGEVFVRRVWNGGSREGVVVELKLVKVGEMTGVGGIKGV